MVVIRPGGAVHEGVRVPRHLDEQRRRAHRHSPRARGDPGGRAEYLDPHRQPVFDRRPHQGVEGEGQPGAHRADEGAPREAPAGAARLREGARRRADERARRRARARGDPRRAVEACRDLVGGTTSWIAPSPAAKVLPPPCRACSAPASSRATSPSSPEAGAGSASRSRASSSSSGAAWRSAAESRSGSTARG